MARGFEDVAKRFQAAASARAAGVAEDEATRRQRNADGAVAREALFADLVAVAETIGVIEVERVDDGVTWRHAGREVRFVPMGEGDRVRVAWRELRSYDGRLYREAALADKWVLTFGAPPFEERVPLLHVGLERLLAAGLALPTPDDDTTTAGGATTDPGPSRDAEPPDDAPSRTTGRRL
jgi:hypothetical protein